MQQLQALSAWVSDDPNAQLVIGAALVTIAIACIVAMVMGVLRPVLRSVFAKVPEDRSRIIVRVFRWALGLGLAFGGTLSMDLPWLIVAVMGLGGAEGSESVWGWAKSLLRIAGARIVSMVRGQA